MSVGDGLLIPGRPKRQAPGSGHPKHRSSAHGHRQLSASTPAYSYHESTETFTGDQEQGTQNGTLAKKKRQYKGKRAANHNMAGQNAAVTAASSSQTDSGEVSGTNNGNKAARTKRAVTKKPGGKKNAKRNGVKKGRKTIASVKTAGKKNNKKKSSSKKKKPTGTSKNKQKKALK